MRPSDKSRQMFLDMQEHPEHYSDEQLETMMDELDQEPDIDMAWQQLEIGGERLKTRTSFNVQLRKIAAVFIGLIVISGIAIAAIHLWKSSSDSNPEGESTLPISPKGEETLFSKEREEDGLRADTIIFDNVPLDTMLLEITNYYNVAVDFRNTDARLLRFYFVWKPKEGLDELIKKLNHFESLSVKHEGNKLIVE